MALWSRPDRDPIGARDRPASYNWADSWICSWLICGRRLISEPCPPEQLADGRRALLGSRPLRPRAVARLTAVFPRDVVGVVLELAKLGRTLAAEGLLGSRWCQMHGPGGDVDTAAGDDAPDAQTLASLHAPVVRENAVGRHAVEGIDGRAGLTRA